MIDPEDLERYRANLDNPEYQGRKLDPRYYPASLTRPQKVSWRLFLLAVATVIVWMLALYLTFYLR